MAENGGDNTDASSIRPVSSLRSRFENLGKDSAEQKPVTPGGRRYVSLNAEDRGPTVRPRSSDGRTSLGETRTPLGERFREQPASTGQRRRPTPPKARPQSMMMVTPSQKSPPMVTIDSPHSPDKNTSLDMRVASPPMDSPTRSHSRTVSRSATPAAFEIAGSKVTQAPEPPQIDFASKPKPPKSVAEPGPAAKLPPPVNRTGKPNVPSKPPALAQKPSGLSAPEPNPSELSDTSASPFSTPPSSGDASPEKEKEPFGDHARHGSDASFVERLRSDSGASSAPYRARGNSDASFVQRLRGDSDASGVSRARAESDSSFAEPSSLPDRGFQPPPTHHHVATRREQYAHSLSRAPTMQNRHHPKHESAANDSGEDRPRLPARPELQTRSGRTSPTKPRSGRTSPSKLSQMHRPVGPPKRAATLDEQNPTRIPATKPAQHSALNQGFGRLSSPAAPPVRTQAPVVPAPRRSADMRRPQIPPVQTEPTSQANGHSRDAVEDLEPPTPQQTALTDFPDSSRANRRPPRYRQRPWQIPTEYDTKLCAVSGEYVVTTGHSTRAWNLRTGEQLLNMAHNENVRVTALAFKPTPNPADEGKRVWLGTNTGEIHEVDISIQSLVKTKFHAHTRREIIRMYRHASELWTLDEGGELNVWLPDSKGMASLDSQCHNFRVPRGHTFSMVVGNHLWYASGKDLHIFNPGAATDGEFQVTRQALTSPGTGDITSGAMLSHQPDLVYLGHSNGKVSVYNRKDFSCQVVVNVSVYKLNSLVGVGEYLWAGYNTGMAYVYDTSTVPWTVKKDWQAHERHVSNIVADSSALWKLDRLHVITLGTDNMLRIWDGLLEEDWLDSLMQQHESEYCSFRELTCQVMTWNAGATKPRYLDHSMQDSNFFHDYINTRDAPDIFVFGFQELVDLEDKKTTAKAFFKSKKKDTNEQEHMSHQYRAWRDHLTKCLEDFAPADQPYTLLHTASLVGLFTCVFVKSAERSRIKHVHTAEVKRGMGGLHGNKGALIMRLVLDDSSMCFINCHLAAGQTQTIQRNNDVAGILESEALPPYPLSQNSAAQHSDVFSSGGDGSMILDHDICILNGDLNYRIDTMGRDTVVKQIEKGEISRLLERDQLLLSRKKNPGFRLRAFQEAPITFAPTYKYNLRSDEYDTSEKRRSPAWCDRILYRGLGNVKMEEYRRWEVRVSDHRPVTGKLKLRVKTVDPARRGDAWKLCVEEFEVVRQRVARAVQLQYLTNVLGLTPQEAKTALPS
ncbi:DNase I-like protein [Hortaea werneckii]|nr:DNase I-like protein [Hortaea werneckii]